MSSETIHLHHAAPAKPAVGQPCNGCGVCCALETCPAGRLRFRRVAGPCPALEWSTGDSRYRCGLLAHPGHHLGLPAVLEAFAARCLARWIAAGQGCDCDAEVQS
ncbi:MAG: hypothetical protein CVU18_09625 [Betaproteobacteria bacterium HGW-Betaproteobacteria-12]|nr:MAG: hypothetical protein CVU18_09625 [Betaproteobacteria bacterium HGW-Betaproteobacteria-12]